MRNKNIQFLLFFVPIIILFAISSLFIEQQLEKWMMERVQTELSGKVAVIAEVLKVTPVEKEFAAFDRFIDRLSVNSPYRLTMIRDDGIVMADSWVATEKLPEVKNHADRPEIQTARTDKPGTAIRHSSTVNTDMLYLAIPFGMHDFTGFIRAAIPLNIVHEYLSQLHNMLIGSGLTGLLLLLAIIIFATRSINRINLRHRQELEQKVSNKTRDISLIQKFSQMLTGCETIEEISEVVLAAAPSIFTDTAGALSLNPPSMDHIEVIATWGDGWHPAKIYQPNDCWAFRRGTYHISEEGALGLKCRHFETIHPVLCVPLVAQGVSLGALHIMSHGDRMTDRLKEMALTVAEHLSLSMANVNLRNSLLHQAVRDPLTNLYNRRYLDEALPRDIRRAKRRHKSVGIMMIDVDHFKTFNDTFGHEAGDYVLQELGGMLMNAVRGEDIACRYGGEEFALLLPETDLETTEKRAWELLHSVRDRNLKFRNKALGHITLSIGISAYPQHGEDIETLISVADEALYRAKNEGRNRIVVATQQDQPRPDRVGNG